MSKGACISVLAAAMLDMGASAAAQAPAPAAEAGWKSERKRFQSRFTPASPEMTS